MITESAYNVNSLTNLINLSVVGSLYVNSISLFNWNFLKQLHKQLVGGSYEVICILYYTI